MEASSLLLSRIQFAATVSFHILFPSFTIGLAAWLAVLEAMALVTGNRVYREVFGFWLKIFGVAFGMGLSPESLWHSSSGRTGMSCRDQVVQSRGHLSSYESFTAFALEATFFGVMLFGRRRVRRGSILCPVHWSRWARRCQPPGSS
ncbi:cytochrome ubiquinol oxidase subunit I [Paraburkholderia sp. CNPSo 3272]|nr:cytochrome ubiquinol oxidase subunit I [Paraburkholderia sp. CNPSo 3272]MCP3727761.1 cytochrome ubiquinol oxidase subunit I [Paraburkholderia sp. CNPSo 3272]